jgi:hypothetical protein
MTPNTGLCAKVTPADNYRKSIGDCLMGYQLLEEQLKAYLGNYHDAVRYFISRRLHYGHEYSDVANLPLGRLISLFSKSCSDQPLLLDLRNSIPFRDSLAHRAFLIEFSNTQSDREFMNMAMSALEQTSVVSRLIERVMQHREAVMSAVKNANGLGA